MRVVLLGGTWCAAVLWRLAGVAVLVILVVVGYQALNKSYRRQTEERSTWAHYVGRLRAEYHDEVNAQDPHMVKKLARGS